MVKLSPPQKRLVVLALVIAAVIFLRARGFSFGVSAFYVKYGGSALWAAMIYLLMALLLRARTSRQILIAAALVCAAVEGLKLVHTPALDVFRLTQAGAWLLGRLFGWANFLAYAVGLAAAFGIDLLLVKKSDARRRR